MDQKLTSQRRAGLSVWVQRADMARATNSRAEPQESSADVSARYFHFLDLAGLPRLVEPGLERAIEADHGGADGWKVGAQERAHKNLRRVRVHENCAGGCAEICAAMLPTLTSCKMKRVARPHEGPTQKPLHQLRERLALPCPTTKAEPESTHMGAAAPNRQVIWGERVPGAPNRPCSVGLMTKSGGLRNHR